MSCMSCVCACMHACVRCGPWGRTWRSCAASAPSRSGTCLFRSCEGLCECGGGQAPKKKTSIHPSIHVYAMSCRVVSCHGRERERERGQAHPSCMHTMATCMLARTHARGKAWMGGRKSEKTNAPVGVQPLGHGLEAVRGLRGDGVPRLGPPAVQVVDAGGVAGGESEIGRVVCRMCRFFVLSVVRTCTGSCPPCGRRTWRATSLQSSQSQPVGQSASVPVESSGRYNAHRTQRTEVKHGGGDAGQVVGQELDHVVELAQVPPGGVALSFVSKGVGMVKRALTALGKGGEGETVLCVSAPGRGCRPCRPRRAPPAAGGLLF